MTKKKRILFLPKYPRLGASSRLRTFQFVELLRQEGYDVSISSFFNERYLQQLYAKKKPAFWNVLSCYFQRFFTVLGAKDYDVVWVEKEIFPFVPAWFELWMRKKSISTLLLDYDDAVFHNYDLHENPWVRKLLGTKVADIIQTADLVLAGSPYLKDYAKKAGASKIYDLPTVIDWNRYQAPAPTIPSPQPMIGWIGSPSTLRYLQELVPVLEKVYQQFPFTLLLIKGKEKLAYSGDVIDLAWSEELEVPAIQQLAIGIMPLPDSSWERGKCAYKLIQYMACGKPVIASPVGVNVEVVHDGVNGFLADSAEDWEQALLKLLRNSDLRQQLGEAGRQLVKKHYTIEQNMIRIRKALAEVL